MDENLFRVVRLWWPNGRCLQAAQGCCLTGAAGTGGLDRGSEAGAL